MTNLFKASAPPPVQAPPAMPNPNDPANVAAANAAAAAASMYGRSSTTLTRPASAGTIAGGAAYSGTKLGGA